MPLTPGAPPSKTIPELHTGRTYSHTAAKFGAKRAQKQAIAIALSNERKGRAMGGMIPQGVAPGMPPSPLGQAVMGPNPMPGQMPQNSMPGQMPQMPLPSTMQGVAPPMGMMPRPMNTGGVAERAFGGFSPLVKAPFMSPLHEEKQEARNMTKGPILSAVPGRTDAHFTHVPSGSYVIPADIVSGRGQGNTIAGAHSLSQMFKMGPYGSSMPKMGGGHGLPKPPAIGKLASGGGKSSDGHIGHPVKVKLAGGEIVVPPENLMSVVHPNLKIAHKIMDAWVLHERKKLRKTLAKLPGPAHD